MSSVARPKQRTLFDVGVTRLQPGEPRVSVPRALSPCAKEAGESSDVIIDKVVVVIEDCETSLLRGRPKHVINLVDKVTKPESARRILVASKKRGSYTGWTPWQVCSMNCCIFYCLVSFLTTLYPPQKSMALEAYHQMLYKDGDKDYAKAYDKLRGFHPVTFHELSYRTFWGWVDAHKKASATGGPKASTGRKHMLPPVVFSMFKDIMDSR
jgi:hypothetical protein